MGRRTEPASIPDFSQMLMQFGQDLEAALTQLVRSVGYTGKFEAILGDGNGRIIVPQNEQSLPRTFFVRKVDNHNNPTDVLEAVNEWDGLVYSNHQPEIAVTCARKPGSPFVSIVGPGNPLTTYAVGGNATPAQFDLFKAKNPTLSQIIELRLMPGEGTEVKVNEGAWWVGNTLYHTHEKVLGDLASYVPATAGKAKYVLVGIDTAGAMQVTDGTEFDITALPRPAESGTNTKAEGVHGLGHVRLYEGLTQLAKTDIVPRHAIPTVAGSGSGVGIPGLCQLRITTVSGEPVPMGGNPSTNTIYLTEYIGKRVDLFNPTTGLPEPHYLTSEIETDVSAVSTGHQADIFVYDDNGELILEVVSWGSATVRGTALGKHLGVPVKDGEINKLHIGTIYKDTGTGEVVQNLKIGGVWNRYNKVLFPFYVVDGTDSWTYNSTIKRALNNNTNNNLTVAKGDKGDLVQAIVKQYFSNPAANAGHVTIGLNSSTVDSAILRGAWNSSSAGYSDIFYNAHLFEGRQILYLVEYCNGAGGNVTFYGDAGAPDIFQQGAIFWSWQ